MKPIAILLGVILSCTSLFSQSQWGQITPEMVQVSGFAPFEEEDAVILHKSATYQIEMLPSGWEARIRHYVRIKIQSQAGVEHGDVELYFYPEKRQKEIARFKGQIHYLENGELKKEEVTKVYEEELTPEVSVLRCAFPHVSPGAIIEYRYDELRSSIFSYSFNFQEDLAVIKSEFKWNTKDDVGYAFAYQGANIEALERIGKEDSYHWNMEHLPALKDVPFVPNMEDYRSKMNMQLAAYANQRRGRVEKVLGSWEDFTKELYEEKRFGRFDKKNGLIAEMTRKITADIDDPLRKMRLIHEYVRDRMEWNGDYRIFSDALVEKIFERKTGSNAEINLLLTCMLQKAGLEAYPTLVSTRDYGQAIKAYPLLNQFNALIVWAKAGDQEFFMDATRSYLDMDMLPTHFLNAEGWILDPENARWGRIQTQVPQKRSLYAKMTIDETGSIKGNFREELTGYLALEVRAIYNQKGKGAFKSDYLSERYPGLSLENISVQIPQGYNAPVTIKGDFSQPEASMSGEDIQYIQPFQGWGLTDNPLKKETRIYPLDFSYPETELITLVMNIPEGWKVEEKPENIAFAIPDRTAIFRFSGSTIGQSLQLQSQYKRTSPFYEATEYAGLRQIYSEINTRHTSPIILKKIATEASDSSGE